MFAMLQFWHQDHRQGKYKFDSGVMQPKEAILDASRSWRFSCNCLIDFSMTSSDVQELQSTTGTAEGRQDMMVPLQ
jgi:hypothetical protein